MALWLAAVIVLITVGLMPSGAAAHAGHPHAAGVAATAPSPAVSAEARPGSEARLGGEDRILLPRVAIRTIVVLTAAPTQALSTGACDGTCCNAGCRSPNACCTGAGLAPDSDDAAGPRRSGDRALARALPARTDVVPEALPEPPRFNA
ncbi:hypothetical protein [Methylobacterium sp. Leaf125]|uniref:hypothetical protein n=1 Tax=Methylobacterium sp. Leaf125 TaxID=1736265 RepID=UPI0012E1F7D5|nr:hypothetical protein [Methylobacterium sp. Leaf125]